MNITTWLFNRLQKHIAGRKPDVIIGEPENPYLLRWWITPFRGWTDRMKRSQSPLVRDAARVVQLIPNVYLHQFLRSDDDRALHDHPWLFNLSWILEGAYIEFSNGPSRWLMQGQIKIRFGRAPHRVQLLPADNGDPPLCPVWTLFITGPVVREWGFLCPKGWVHWKDFTANNGATIGKGCNQ